MTDNNTYFSSYARGLNWHGDTNEIINSEIIDSKVKLDRLVDSAQHFFNEHAEHGEKYYIDIEIDLINESIKQNINLSNCVFLKKVKIINSIFNLRVDFRDCKFNSEVDLSRTTFENKTRFHSSIFEMSVNLFNTKFNELIDFYLAEFKAPQLFHLTDFMDRAIFSNVSFKDQVQFIYNKVSSNSIISFENATFHNSIDISRSNFWCKLQFWGIKILNTIPENLWLYENDLVKCEDISKPINALPKLRESYRIIKHTFRSEGNNIEALNYQQKELKLLKAENSIKSYKKHNIKFPLVVYKTLVNKISQIENYITINFNSLSNNFGQSWFKGALFTLSTTVIFFYLYLRLSGEKFELDFSKDSILLTLKYIIQFLNITKWDINPFEIDIKSYDLGYLILFVGRIFIGYGYYQTIQAFRKYGKN